MRASRAAWIGLNIISYICVLIFLGFAITVQISQNWTSYAVSLSVLLTNITSSNQNEWTRYRGLWKQCIPNTKGRVKLIM